MKNRAGIKLVVVFIVSAFIGIQASSAFSISISSTSGSEGSYSSPLGGSSTSLGSTVNIQSSTVTSGTTSGARGSGSSSSSFTTGKTPDPEKITISDKSVTKKQGSLLKGGNYQYSVTFNKPSRVMVKVPEEGGVQVYAKKGGTLPSLDTFMNDYTKKITVTKDSPAKLKTESGIWYFTIYAEGKPSKYSFSAQGA